MNVWGYVNISFTVLGWVTDGFNLTVLVVPVVAASRVFGVCCCGCRAALVLLLLFVVATAVGFVVVVVAVAAQFGCCCCGDVVRSALYS